MGGAQCLEKLLTLNPSLKIVIISAFLGDEAVKESLNSGAEAVLRKPFTIVEVLEVIRKALKK